MLISSCWDNNSGTLAVVVVVLVVGMLKRRDEYSGLSMENDLNDDDDDECRFCSVITTGIGLSSTSCGCGVVGNSSGNLLLSSIFMLI